MQQYDKKTRWLGNAIASFVLILLLAVFAALISGCTRTIYVPTESTAIRSDSLNLSTIRQLLIQSAERERQKELLTIFHDRVVTVNERGDTVKDKENTYVSHDTQLEKEDERLTAENNSLKERLSSRDSVRVKEPYPVEKIVEVERKRRWWETALMWAGGIALIGFGCMIYRKAKK